MRTKKKSYNYDSSDFDNGDYGQEDFDGEEDEIDEEDQQEEESDYDSDYNSSNGNPKKNQQSNQPNVKQRIDPSRHRQRKEPEEDMEDSYEEEDPFSPEIDQILADKQVDVPNVQMSAQCKYFESLNKFDQQKTNLFQGHQKIYSLWLHRQKYRIGIQLNLWINLIYMQNGWKKPNLKNIVTGQNKRSEDTQTKKRKSDTYLYLNHNILYTSLQMDYGQAQQPVFKQAKNHHFSDDDEEEDDEEDAAIKGISIPIIPMVSDDVNEQEANKPQYIKVEASDGEDLSQHFDKNYIQVERILSTTLIFPVIHPRQAKQIRGKWQEDCLKVVNVLVNFKKNNVAIGLVFAEQLDPDNEDLVDYFKVIKQPIDFTMIMNRLYNRLYQQPQDFWNDLGLVFKNCRLYYKSNKKGLRKQCDVLRTLAYHLYNDWYNEQMNRFKTGVALPIPPPPSHMIQQQLNQPSQQPDQMLQISNGGQTQQSQPTKDITIVNLQSLLKSQQSALQPAQASEQTQDAQPQLSQNPQQVPNMMQSQSQQQPQQQIQAQQQPQFQNSSMSTPNNMLQQQTDNSQIQQMNDQWNAQQQQLLQRNQQQQMPQLSTQGSFQNPMMQSLGQTRMFGQQQQQPNQQMPSLPGLNQIMNPLNQQQQQQQFQQNSQLQFQQPMNQGMMPSNQSNSMMQPFMGQQQQPQNQAELMQLLGMGGIPQGLGGLSQLAPQQMMDPQGSMGVHLPSMGQIQQTLPFMMGFQQPKPALPFNDPNQQINPLQQLQQQQDKNMNFMNQMIGMSGQQNSYQDQLSMMNPASQDFNQFGMRNLGGAPQLPSMSQLSGLGQQLGNSGGFQLPSLSSLGQNLGSQMSTFDPYGNSMMNLMQGQNNPNFMNQMMQSQQHQNMFNQLKFPSGVNSSQAYDEMSMMLGNLQHPMSGMPGGFNPFGNQMDINQAQQMLGAMNNNQFLGIQPSQQNQFSQQQHQQSHQQPHHLPSILASQSQLTSQNNPFQKPSNQLQSTRIIDPNLIQPERNNEDYNDKEKDPPVPPCIMDPGEYNLTWILDNANETIDQIAQSQYLSQQEIEQAIQNKHYVDQLYLLKWKSLSYTQASWEPESTFRYLYEEKVQDFFKYNRSLDQFQRERLDQLIKNHKKMLRVTEKKYQQGKRIDANQENLMSLQESKINRQLLNHKIQEIMGDYYYQVVQYSEQKNIVPQFKKPWQKLKDYQVIGLNWLIRAWHEHRNVVLADEMGLGKTIMTLSLFDHLNKVYKLRGPYLILAPLTTLEHWKRIADEWTTLNSVLYYDPGSSEGRAEIRHWEWFYTDVTYKGTVTQKSELYKFNLIITSFEVFMQDLNPILQEIPFTYIVVDEAHRLKNKQAKTLKLLKDHPCKRILLLTGTPVQNNTKELWTLLNYIEPEKFNSMEYFLEQYGNLESYEQIQKLHTILKPHFLRRLKEEVDNSIPPLQETVIEVGLTNLQNTYYKGIYGENRMVLAKFGTNSIKTSQLNNMDVQLRKCCNHLFLLKGVEEELTRDCKNEEDFYNKLLDSSGKLMLLDKFIEKFKQENHKMLIFSQFKRMLDIIEFYLKIKHVPYEKLTGSVKTQDRISAIQRFNDDKTFGVFLLTTRAGGLGINLTSARVVIIFDSDWNPQNDLQAIARAHRIGQKFEVQVYRLITQKTYEEQMFERASKKLGMEQALFSKGAFHQNDDFELSSLHLRGIHELKQDSKEIENLLKYGAYAFIDNEGNEGDEQKNKDIDEILATGKKKEFTYSKGLYTLQKSTFNASKYEKLPDVNDPDFWNKVMPFDSIISITMLEKRFKKEKKEMGKNDKMQKEFFKDLEIVFNDFMDAKFDVKTSVASKKQLESDEEKLREILKKMIRLSNMKLLYVEKCKEWLRDMLRTNKRKKPEVKQQEQTEQDNAAHHNEFEDEQEQNIEDDDIILYDSDENINNRNLRRRNPTAQQKQLDSQANNQDPSLLPKKRGRKPKNQQLIKQEQNNGDQQEGTNAGGQEGEGDQEEELDEYDEEEEEEEDDGYDDEEDKDYYINKGQNSNQTGQTGKQGKQPVAMQEEQSDNMQDYGEEDDDEPEQRYGLRGRNKRQKTAREQLMLASSSNNQVMSSNQMKNMLKMNEQLAKRNEKNGIVCAYCLHPETGTSFCTYFCSGYCQRYFHEECKDTYFSNGSQKSRNQFGQWQCDDCLTNKAICFCCKQKGQILLFPKKGKPKAAGSANDPLLQNSCSMLQEEDQDDANQIMNEEPECVATCDQNIKIEADQQKEEDKEQEQLIDQVEEELKPEEPLLTQEIKTENFDAEIKALEQEPIVNQPDQQTCVADQDMPPVDQVAEQQSLDLQKSQSTKIVLQNFGNQEKQQSVPQTPVGMKQQQQMGQSPSEEPTQNDAKFVVRCTLGGCFKYYHVNCVYKNKNVSCINSMKVQRFRCPLHYCEICQASGDSVLIVQCVTCPTAYHLKCLPQDTRAIRLTKKYIICGKHNLSQEDFPKYEEKNQISNYGKSAGQQMQITGITASGQKGSSIQSKQDKQNKNKLKRGRKAKSSGAFEDEEQDEFMSQPDNSKTMQQQTQQNKQQIKLSIGQLQPITQQASQQTSFVIKLSGTPSQPSQQQQPFLDQQSFQKQHSFQKNSVLSNTLQHSSSSSLKGDTPKPLFLVEKTVKGQRQSENSASAQGSSQFQQTSSNFNSQRQVNQ